MSVEAMKSFVNKVAETEALHAPALDAWTRGGMEAFLNLGKTHGYEFTAEDVIAVRDMPQPDTSPALSAFGEKLAAAWEARGELTDSELELVAGGTGGEIFGPVTKPPKI